MQRPTLDIQIAPDSHQTCIKVNGEDYSHLCHGIKISQVPGHLPIVEITIYNFQPTHLSGEAILRLKDIAAMSEDAIPTKEGV